MSYTVKPSVSLHGLKNKVALIYDVPEYFNIKTKVLPKKIGLIKVRQYQGLLTNLETFTNFNSYFAATFSKKSRYKFNSYLKNLESSFDISYKHFYGSIESDTYCKIFERFNALLKKRFEDKLESNNNLDTKEWDFYFNSSLELILEKKASLFVIYNGEIPIGISLNYFSEDILFFAMTVFDIDYFKYNIGKVHLMKLYQWCFEHNINTFDLSKGYYDYKERWSNVSYNFEYHIYYDSNSMRAFAMAQLLKAFFKLKQFLRDKEINKKLHKTTFLLKKVIS
tara:strand:- start:220 stop:1062 length:843 start_codon:yes stop_codon:yes gene_type:complete